MPTNWVLAGEEAEIRQKGVKVIPGSIAVFAHEDNFYAVENRCPHMGFPLHMAACATVFSLVTGITRDSMYVAAAPWIRLPTTCLPIRSRWKTVKFGSIRCLKPRKTSRNTSNA
ncbi:Rieske (2Fe-2S) protein [Alicyclobacillus fodiniaquatilis]|uniref:Rieske (2Fe-2S) protein n=1 Tax=Alicyclobacillus fodiniaquatilis TaxID=1661150 RepID=A0ABW4JJF0_9BACL